MRTICVVIAGWMMTVGLVFAQQANNGALQPTQGSFKGERVVEKLPLIGKDAEVDKYRCGDFFMFEEDNPNLRPRGPRLYYNTEKRPDDPAGTAFMGTFLLDKFVVIVDDKKKAPTVEFRIRNNTIEDILLRLSRKDLKKAPCLQGPSQKNHV